LGELEGFDWDDGNVQKSQIKHRISIAAQKLRDVA